MMRSTKTKIAKRMPLWLAALFLALILVPTLFLAYFSVKAIEGERLLYRQRILDSYTHLAQFARDEIFQMIRDLGDRWLIEIQPTDFVKLSPDQKSAFLKKFVAKEALVTRAYLIESNGRVQYPPLRRPKAHLTAGNPAPARIPQFQTWLNRFRQLSDLAEQMEFEKNLPDSALAIYRQIVRTNPVAQFEAIALREMARIYMFKGEWQEANRYYQKIIEEFPNVRDLNNLHLRFDARFQSVVALENLGDFHRAMESLLVLYQDLLDHSDEVNEDQYKFFLEKIRKKYQGLIGGFTGQDREKYQRIFNRLQEQKKKKISSHYFVQKLQQRLIRAVIKRNTYRPRFKYVSDFQTDEPYLMAYIFLSPGRQVVVEEVMGFEINVDSLKSYLFSGLLRRRKFPQDVTTAIIDEKNKLVMGDADKIVSLPAVQVALRDPLNFWRLGIFPVYGNPLLDGEHYALYFKLWGTFLLVVLILSASTFLIYYIRRQQLSSLQKSTFVSSISHELRTPLTSIRMFAELLTKENQGFSPKQIKFLGVIRGETQRLERMIENVLDFAQIERGVKKYNFDFEDPTVIIESAVDSLHYQSEMTGVPIELELAENLPEIYTDRDAFRQALLNLLSNALKYSVDKQPVTVRGFVRDRHLVIQVADRGVGIDEKHLSKIFDNFYRVEEGEAAHIGGSGLGLATTRYIIEAHRGTIEVESRVGHGTTFTVKIPLANK